MRVLGNTDFLNIYLLSSRDKWAPVTTPWSFLRLYREKAFRIYWISSRGQPTRGDPSASGLGELLTAAHSKNLKLSMSRNDWQSLGLGLMNRNDVVWLRTGSGETLCLVHAVTNLRVPLNAGYFLINWGEISLERMILIRGVSYVQTEFSICYSNNILKQFTVHKPT